jgi:hypothetical protein
MTSRIGKQKKREVALRASYRCEYCQSSALFSPDPFSIEHIIPISKGGKDEEGNIAYACQGCNNRKYTHTKGLDPVTNTLVPLFHPREELWQYHFQWSVDWFTIIGVTPSGRATTSRLKLNREGVVNLRKVLLLAGEHPPK